MPFIQIYPQGIQHLLNNLDVIKSGGPDKLPARFLKEVAAEVAPALSIIYQASLDQGVLPAVWKTATIVPIYKKGSRSAAVITDRSLFHVFVQRYYSILFTLTFQTT